MITAHDNPKLKLIRRLLREKRERVRSGLFAVEGEDLVAAASDHGWEPQALLEADVDVDARLLAEVSTLGSGTRVIGVYEQRWSEPGGNLSVYLHAVADPGNVGTIIRATHALADGPTLLGPDCADPFSPKATRASMGSVFARPPARADFDELRGQTLALVAHGGIPLAETRVEAPLTVCLGAEREGLPGALAERADVRARIPLRTGGPDSLNVAMAATVALYERNRMAPDA